MTLNHVIPNQPSVSQWLHLPTQHPPSLHSCQICLHHVQLANDHHMLRLQPGQLSVTCGDCQSWVAKYHRPISITHGIQSRCSHTSTRAHTTNDERINALELESCVEVGREEGTRVALGDDKLPLLRLQARNPTFQTRFIAFLKCLQQRRLTIEHPSVGHIRLGVFHARPNQWHLSFARRVYKSSNRGRCSCRCRVRAGVQRTIFAPVRVANVDQKKRWFASPPHFSCKARLHIAVVVAVVLWCHGFVVFRVLDAIARKATACSPII